MINLETATSFLGGHTLAAEHKYHISWHSLLHCYSKRADWPPFFISFGWTLDVVELFALWTFFTTAFLVNPCAIGSVWVDGGEKRVNADWYIGGVNKGWCWLFLASCVSSQVLFGMISCFHPAAATVGQQSESDENNTQQREVNNGHERRSYLSRRRWRSWQIQSHLHSDQVRHSLLRHFHVRIRFDWPTRFEHREAFVHLNPRTVLPEVTIPPNVTPGHDVQTVIIDTSREFQPFYAWFRNLAGFDPTCSWSLDD